MLLRFDGGARAVATISQVSAGRKNLLSIRGRRLRGRAGLGFGVARAAVARPPRAANELLLRDASLMHPGAAATTQLPGGHAEGFADTFRELYRAVYADVAAGSPADGRRTRRLPTATRRC